MLVLLWMHIQDTASKLTARFWRTICGAAVRALVEVVAGQQHCAQHGHQVRAALERRAGRLQRAQLPAHLHTPPALM